MTELTYPSSTCRGSRYSGGGRQHPTERSRRRQQRREHAARLLWRYLGEVTSALRAEGFVISDVQTSPGPDLEARLRVRPPEPRGGRHSTTSRIGSNGGQSTGAQQPRGGPVDGRLAGSPFELSWAEDTGWCVEHHLLGGPTQAAPWRYLHLELVPAPSAVARFAAAVLTDFDHVGMPYPAQFRYRSQPLQPVIEALARHATTPHSAINAATNAAINAAINAATNEGIGEVAAAVADELAEPVTGSQRKGAG